MITFPNSKINLGLNVLEKRPDGYHNIETIFYPVNLQDALEVTTARNCDTDFRLHISGNPVDGKPEDNLVVRACRLIKQDYELPPVDIHMYKHIPSGAGLGGGSSDAAFMIKMLNHKFHIGLSELQMEEYAARLGSDCAFFIKNKPAYATGTGNILEPIELSLKGYYLLLVKPDIFVSTKEAYGQLTPLRPQISLKDVIRSSVKDWKELMVNDFEKTVFAKYPLIGDIKDKLYRMGAVYASMSGSGSSVFGLFKEQKKNIEDEFPRLFCRQRELE